MLVKVLYQDLHQPEGTQALVGALIQSFGQRLGIVWPKHAPLSLQCQVLLYVLAYITCQKA